MAIDCRQRHTSTPESDLIAVRSQRWRRWRGTPDLLVPAHALNDCQYACLRADAAVCEAESQKNNWLQQLALTSPKQAMSPAARFILPSLLIVIVLLALVSGGCVPGSSDACACLPGLNCASPALPEALPPPTAASNGISHDSSVKYVSDSPGSEPEGREHDPARSNPVTLPPASPLASIANVDESTNHPLSSSDTLPVHLPTSQSDATLGGLPAPPLSAGDGAQDSVNIRMLSGNGVGSSSVGSSSPSTPAISPSPSSRFVCMCACVSCLCPCKYSLCLYVLTLSAGMRVLASMR